MICYKSYRIVDGKPKWRFKVDRTSYNDTYHNMKLENCNVLRSDGT